MLKRKLESLSDDKRKRIIDVCIEEFALNGYDKASTNVIVKKAGISKGLLFHYFSSKRNLYLYVVDYAVERLTDMMFSMDTNLPKDIFERFVYWGIIKLKVAYAEPLMFKLVFTAFTNVPDEVKSQIESKRKELYELSRKRLLKDIDFSKFRKDINHTKAVECITLLMDGLYNKYLNELRSYTPDKAFEKMNEIVKDYMEYVEMLKRGIYG